MIQKYTALALGLVLLGACLSNEPRPRVEASVALSAFDTVYEVLQHPRCMNCHPAGDRPLQHMDSRPHAMNVMRGEDDRGRPGMRCTACHGHSNPDGAHLPPGSPVWHLAPREMVFEGLSKSQLAGMLLDEERSHKTPEELIEHVAHDELVLWGWNPGIGREPVPVPHETFVEAVRTWIDGGAPIPAEPKESR